MQEGTFEDGEVKAGLLPQINSKYNESERVTYLSALLHARSPT